MNSNLANLHEKAPTHTSATYAITIFIKISRIGFTGNPAKIFISSNSASLTESNNLFGPRKISTGKIELLGIQPIHDSH